MDANEQHPHDANDDDDLVVEAAADAAGGMNGNNNNNNASAAASASDGFAGGEEEDDYEEEEEEEECRVCRGPAEPDHPLFKPCKCSGSIGLTHQDCLQSWLQVQQRGGVGGGAVGVGANGGTTTVGKCELCKTPFRFSPLYQPDAPERLPAAQVLVGLSRRACAHWLPFVLRSIFCASLWLVVAPTVTAYLYHGWMHRPTAVLERVGNWKLFPADVVSGAVVAACIIISFLSLMSFADFMRVEWQQVRNQQEQQEQEAEDGGGVGGGARGNNRRGRRRRQQQDQQQGGDERGDEDNVAEDAGGAAPAAAGNNNNNNNNDRIDNSIWDVVQEQRQRRQEEQQRNQEQEQQREGEAAGVVPRPMRVFKRRRVAAAPAESAHNDDEDNDGDDDARDTNGGGDALIAAGDHNHEAALRQEGGGGGDDEANDLDALDDDDDDDEDYVDDDEDDEDDLEEEDEEEFDDLEEDEVVDADGHEGEEEWGQRFGGAAAGARDNADINNNDDPPPAFGGGMDGGGGAGGGAFVGGMDPEDAAAAADMDINIALDELLGVRGPLGAVIRNLLWLVAFNCVYLGFFAFTPRVLGTAVIAIFFSGGTDNNNSNIDSGGGGNATTAAAMLETAISNASMAADDNVTMIDNATSASVASTTMSAPTTLLGVYRAIEAESDRVNTTFRLADLATVTLGYLSCAAAVVLIRFIWMFSQKVRFLQRGWLAGARMAANANHNHHNNNNQNAQQQQEHAEMEVREALDEMNRIVHGMGHDLMMNDNNNMDGNGGGAAVVSISVAIGVALDAMIAIVKVGVLLFLKMFLLPVLLGLCLDASTMRLFGSTIHDAIRYAGTDLFAFILLHWVAGITFMLLVTVSVLQLREVAHPDLLAQMIRPQEPQPDLLGNLMHESVGTHTKRMVLSLAIYAVLLTMHVYVPVRVLMAGCNALHNAAAAGAGAGADEADGGDMMMMAADAAASGEDVASSSVCGVRLKFWYLVMPQLQVPLELLFFHLCMLALLEKYKNSIGEMQHYWLVFMSRVFNMTASMLPLSVDQFALIATKPIFVTATAAQRLDQQEQERPVDASADENNGAEPATRTTTTAATGGQFEVDQFWYDLVKAGTEAEREARIQAALRTELAALEEDPYAVNGLRMQVGRTNARGERVLTPGTDFIRLPAAPGAGAGAATSSRDAQQQQQQFRYRNKPQHQRSVLLPTKIGQFRLSSEIVVNPSSGGRVSVAGDDPHRSYAVTIWQERLGQPIPRPPEGWDDLGQGGADIQGRWAWGREKRSRIEGGVARRRPFFKGRRQGGREGEGESHQQEQQQSMLEMAWIGFKILLLLVFSWVAATLLLCVVLASPLFLGRLLYYTFRVPTKWMHDPLAFALGSSIFFPLLKTVAVACVAGNAPVWQRLAAWLGRFRMPSARKCIVLLETAVLWFGVVPLLLGGLYEFCFIKPVDWFAGADFWDVDGRDALLTWATGMILLYFWSRLCVAGVLTRQFWVLVLEGGAAVDDNNNNNNDNNNNIAAADRQAAAWQAAGGNRIRLVWQGQHGRLSQFYNVWKSCWTEFDWEKVDPSVLIQDVAMPVVTELCLTAMVPAATGCFLAMVAVVGPSTLFFASSWRWSATAVAVAVRFSFGCACVVQAGRVWEDQVRAWFRAAHKTARDDRYLIGEVLMNYGQQEE